MTTAAAGVTPRHCRYSYIWPPAYETMSVLIPNLFNVPLCDFGVGPIGGDLRSLAAYAVSSSIQCACRCLPFTERGNTSTTW
ncbi:unnamed protein product, partial [Ectocarpus sp. 13 AM-2016]